MLNLGKLNRIILECEDGRIEVIKPTRYTFITKLEPSSDEDDPNIQGTFSANEMTVSRSKDD